VIRLLAAGGGKTRCRASPPRAPATGTLIEVNPFSRIIMSWPVAAPPPAAPRRHLERIRPRPREPSRPALESSSPSDSPNSRWLLGLNSNLRGFAALALEDVFGGNPCRVETSSVRRLRDRQQAAARARPRRPWRAPRRPLTFPLTSPTRANRRLLGRRVLQLADLLRRLVLLGAELLELALRGPVLLVEHEDRVNVNGDILQLRAATVLVGGSSRRSVQIDLGAQPFNTSPYIGARARRPCRRSWIADFIIGLSRKAVLSFERRSALFTLRGGSVFFHEGGCMARVFVYRQVSSVRRTSIPRSAGSRATMGGVGMVVRRMLAKLDTSRASPSGVQAETSALTPPCPCSVSVSV